MEEARGQAGCSSEEEKGSEGSREDSPTRQLRPAQPVQQQQQGQEGGDSQGPSPDLPFTPPLPDTYEQLARMAEGLSAPDLRELVSRIRAFNAPLLTSQSRKRLQLLYGFLVQHFATLAGRTPLSLPHLDALVPHLVDMTPQVPFYAATLARTRLQRAEQRMSAALSSPDPAQRASAWPTPRTLLLLKLWATVFPTTDKRHPVLTPATLLATGALTLCPLARPFQVALGLYLSSLAVHMHSQARRYVPEPLNYAVALLDTVLPSPDGGAAAAQRTQRGIEGEDPRWLCIPPGDGGGADMVSLPATAAAIPQLSFQKVLGLASACASASTSATAAPAGPQGQAEPPERVAEAAAAAEGARYFSSPEFKTAAAAAAARLLARYAELFADVAALPEVLAPGQQVLRRILAAGRGTIASGQEQGSQQGQRGEGDGCAGVVIAPGLLEVCLGVLEQLDSAADAARSRRRPLTIPALLRQEEAKQFNPRFEENYAAGKDYDPDRERAERRRLQRQLRKEERGAMRELRKDAVFMAGVRDREKAAKQAELDQSARRAISFLQRQEADFKSGGQGGLWKKGKKGKK